MHKQKLQTLHWCVYGVKRCRRYAATCRKPVQVFRFSASASHKAVRGYDLLIAVSIRLWGCSQHHDGSLMLAERRGMLNESVQAMNEAEMRLIRSPLLSSALQPRKHQNDLLFLRHSQKPLDVSYFGQRSFFPDFTYHSGVSDWFEMCALNRYRHTHTHTRMHARKYTQSKTLTDVHTHTLSE